MFLILRAAIISLNARVMFKGMFGLLKSYVN